MIPFLNFARFLQYFVQVIAYLRLREIIQNDIEEDVDMIMIMSMTMRIMCQYLSMYALVVQRFSAKVRKRKVLVKPHIVIRLLHNYR